MRRTPPAYSRGYAITALVCVVLSLLSGCAFGSGAPATDLPQTPQQASAGSVVNLTFGASDFERRTYQPIIDAFNQGNPNIHVQFVAIDDLYKGDDQNEQLRGIVSRADTAAAYVDPAQLKLGLVRDLKPLMDADASFAPDDFYPAAIQSLSAEGGIYLAPKTIYPFLLSYNKDMWAARGLSAPKPDWNWQDLEAAAQRLAQKQGNTVMVYGLVDNTAYAHAFLGGLDLLSTPPDRLRFDRPDIAVALERVAGLVSSGAFYHWPLTRNANWDAVEQLVRDQKAGMWPADFTSPKGGGPALTFAIGTAAYPASTVPGDRPFSVDGYLMSSGTQHPDEAWAWLSFLSKQAGSESGRPGGLPARKSIAEQSGYWSRLDPEAAAAVRATLARALPPPLPGDVDERIFQPLAQALDDVIAGKPAAQALSEAQAALGNTIASLQLTPTATPNTQPVVVATPVPDVAAPGAVTITFAVAGKGNDQIRKIVEQFNLTNPAIFVQMQDIDFSNGPPNLTDIAANADCFTLFGPPAANELTATLDLQPLIDTDPSANGQAPIQDDYPPALLAPYQQGNQLHGLPWQVGFRTLNYNKEAFDAAGLTTPAATWTIDDFVNAAQKLTTGTDNRKKYGFVMPRAQPEIVRFLIGLSGASLEQSSGASLKPNYTDPKVLQAARAVVDLLRHSSPHTRLEGYTNASYGDRPYDQLIADGRAGMWFGNGSSPYGGKPNFTLAIAPPPLSQGTVTPDAVFSIGMFISAKTDKQAACWSWLKYLSGNSDGLLGLTPARRSVAESEAFKQILPGAAEVYQAYDTALQRAAPAADVSSPVAPIEYYWFDRSVDRALQGKDLERELAEAQTLTEQFLACRNAGGERANCATQVDPSYQG